MSYYEAICHELGEAEYDFRENIIGGREFIGKVDVICSRSNIDFKYLMDTSNKIASLQQENASYDKKRELAQEIERTIKALREKQNTKE